MSETKYRMWEEQQALKKANQQLGRAKDAPLMDAEGKAKLFPEQEKKIRAEYDAKYGFAGGWATVPWAPSWGQFRDERAKTLMPAPVVAPNKRTAVPTKPVQAGMLPSAVPTTGAAGALSVSPTADMDGVNPQLMDKVKTLQTRFGRNLKIISGHRDPKRNSNAGGAKRSQHIHGNAVDLKFNGTREETAELIQMASTMGFGGIGVYGPGNVHLDVGPRRAWGPSHKLASVPDWAKPAINAHLSGSAAMVAMAPTDSYSEVSKSQAAASQAMDVPGFTKAARDMAWQAAAAATDTQAALSAPEAPSASSITGGGAFLPTSGSKESSAAPGIQSATEGVDDIIAKILVAMGAVSQT